MFLTNCFDLTCLPPLDRDEIMKSAMADQIQERKQSLVNSGKIQSIGSTLGAYVQFIPLTKEASGTVTFEVRWRDLFFVLPLSLPIAFQAKAQNDIILCFNTHDEKCVGQEGRDDSPAYEVRKPPLISTCPPRS